MRGRATAAQPTGKSKLLVSHIQAWAYFSYQIRLNSLVNLSPVIDTKLCMLQLV